MPNRILFTALALVGATTTAAAHQHHRGRAALALQQSGASSSNDGATIDSTTGTVLVVAPPVKVSRTFVEFHSVRVENDLMLFKPTLVGIAPMGRGRNADLFATAPSKKAVRFLAPAEAGDGLEVRRDRDRLVLFRGAQSQGASVAIGLAMFIATTVSSAHAPGSAAGRVRWSCSSRTRHLRRRRHGRRYRGRRRKVE